MQCMVLWEFDFGWGRAVVLSVTLVRWQCLCKAVWRQEMYLTVDVEEKNKCLFWSSSERFRLKSFSKEAHTLTEGMQPFIIRHFPMNAPAEYILRKSVYYVWLSKHRSNRFSQTFQPYQSNIHIRCIIYVFWGLATRKDPLIFQCLAWHMSPPLFSLPVA